MNIELCLNCDITKEMNGFLADARAAYISPFMSLDEAIEKVRTETSPLSEVRMLKTMLRKLLQRCEVCKINPIDTAKDQTQLLTAYGAE